MNKLLKVGLFFGIFAIIIPNLSFASCTEKLPRTLTLGMKGNDVKILQQFLNSIPETIISKTGINSKGKENGVFDASTLVAFKKFQTINSNIILKPVGLKVANGVVGNNSRAFINKSFCNETVSNSTSSEINLESYSNSKMTEAEVLAKFDKDLAQMKAKLELVNKKISSTPKSSLDSAKEKLLSIQSQIKKYSEKYISMDVLVKKISDSLNKNSSTSPVTKGVEINTILPANPNSGENIYIFATNLASTNKVYVGNTSFSIKLNEVNDKYITVPLSKNLTPGKYNIYLENSNGKSSVTQISVSKATNTILETIQTPTISSVSPTKGNIGTQVTIFGERFTKNNTIHTTTKSYYDVVSTDGKTLKFTIEADSSLLGNGTKLTDKLPFTFFVRNEYGDSNVSTLKLD